jgi:hypothetical protein
MSAALGRGSHVIGCGAGLNQRALSYANDQQPLSAFESIDDIRKKHPKTKTLLLTTVPFPALAPR